MTYAFYIRLSEAKASSTTVVGEVHLDLDADGVPVGVELPWDDEVARINPWLARAFGKQT